MQPTPYPDLNAVLSELVAGVQGALGDNFLAASLQGSFAVGDFDRHSDVDFIVVIEQDLTSQQVAVAGRGLHALGVDLAAAAIEKARAKAEAAGLAGLATFQVGDALHPARLPGPFGAVVDTGFFHLFGPAEREAFAQELAAALTPGGRYYLLGFAIQSPFPNAPRQVREDELRELFAPERGWRVLALRAAVIQTRSPLEKVPAVAGCLEREA